MLKLISSILIVLLISTQSYAQEYRHYRYEPRTDRLPSHFRMVGTNNAYFTNGEAYYVLVPAHYELVEVREPAPIVMVQQPVIVEQQVVTTRVGNQTKVVEGSLIGGVLGAVAGGVVGHQMKTL